MDVSINLRKFDMIEDVETVLHTFIVNVSIGVTDIFLHFIQKLMTLKL